MRIHLHLQSYFTKSTSKLPSPSKKKRPGGRWFETVGRPVGAEEGRQFFNAQASWAVSCGEYVCRNTYNLGSSGRRNTLREEVAMASRKRRLDRSGRGALPSPGRPSVARREDRRQFWVLIAAGCSSEDAAVGTGEPSDQHDRRRARAAALQVHLAGAVDVDQAGRISAFRSTGGRWIEGGEQRNKKQDDEPKRDLPWRLNCERRCRATVAVQVRGDPPRPSTGTVKCADGGLDPSGLHSAWADLWSGRRSRLKIGP